MYYLRNNEARSWTNRCVGKAIIITYSECVSLILIIQHTKHMHRMTFSSVACLDVPRSPTLPHKRQDFGEKNVIEHKMWVLIFFMSSV
jgi:hypothetical protein